MNWQWCRRRDLRGSESAVTSPKVRAFVEARGESVKFPRIRDNEEK